MVEFQKNKWPLDFSNDLLSAMALTILCVGKGLSYNIFDFIASERIKLLQERMRIH